MGLDAAMLLRPVVRSLSVTCIELLASFSEWVGWSNRYADIVPDDWGVSMKEINRLVHAMNGNIVNLITFKMLTNYLATYLYIYSKHLAEHDIRNITGNQNTELHSTSVLEGYFYHDGMIYPYLVHVHKDGPSYYGVGYVPLAESISLCRLLSSFTSGEHAAYNCQHTIPLKYVLSTVGPPLIEKMRRKSRLCPRYITQLSYQNIDYTSFNTTSIDIMEIAASDYSMTNPAGTTITIRVMGSVGNWTKDIARWTSYGINIGAFSYVTYRSAVSPTGYLHRAGAYVGSGRAFRGVGTSLLLPSVR